MPTKHHGRFTAGALALGLVGTGATALAAPARAAPSTSVVVSEVFGGGGNSGAPFQNDFVELANLSSAPVALTGWTVQYFSSGGSATAAVPLTGSIPAGGRYLVAMAAGAGAGAPLPTPDATGSAAMSATNGRVDLAQGTTLVDRVGYGTATTFETAAAPAASSTTSDARTIPPVDTDDNSKDFSAGAPTPQNAAGDGGGSTPPPAQPATIEQVQGAAHRSPLEGKAVTDVTGVVTAVSGNGFWIQSTTPDADPATSEGLFVFTTSRPTAAVGDRVSVTGTVTEFRAGGATGANLTTTELSRPTTTVLATGQPLPAPVVIGVDRVAPPQTIESGDPGSVESPAATFDPAVDAIDFYESLEGTRVALRDAEVVGPTASFGEIPVVPGHVAGAVRTPRGGVLYSGYDHPNAMRVQLDDALIAPARMPAATVGDTVPGDTVGVVDYSFSNFKLEVTSVPTIASGGLQREVTATPTKRQVAVATFNVENLAPSDPDTTFARLAGQIVQNLQAPDLLALEEIQDNSGAVDDGTVASDATVAKLVAAITAAGGPEYQSRSIDPTDDTDGGQPGGNIRQVFLFRTDRGLSFVDRPGGDAATAVTVQTVKRKQQLSVSPGRIDPGNAAWTTSRKPLVGQFRWKNDDLFVIANHFVSKGGDDPLFGRFQQPVRDSETQRHAQASVVRGFVDQILAADDRADVVVLGDINDVEFSQTADLLVGSGTTALTDLPRTLPVDERYTYVYQGNSQVLDQILISRELTGTLRTDGTTARHPAFDYDVVHTNSEFPDQDSDHEPQVVRLDLKGH